MHVLCTVTWILAMFDLVQVHVEVLNVAVPCFVLHQLEIYNCDKVMFHLQLI